MEFRGAVIPVEKTVIVFILEAPVGIQGSLPDVLGHEVESHPGLPELTDAAFRITPAFLDLVQHDREHEHKDRKDRHRDHHFDE